MNNKFIRVMIKPSLVLLKLLDKVAFLFPDKLFLKIKYYLIMKKRLNLKSPKTFNEKLQWLKLQDRKPEYNRMVDKVEAKKYVAGIIGEEYIIPTLGVYDKFEDIDFDQLPNQFVLKCTHDSGGIIVCNDKTKIDINKAKKILKKSLRINYFYQNREWVYNDIQPRIIALVLLWLIIPPFVHYFYKPEFKVVIKLSYIASIGVMFYGIADFFNRFLGANGDGKAIRNTSIIVGICILISNIIIIPIWQEIGAALTFLIAGVVYFLTIFWHYTRMVKRNLPNEFMVTVY